ncbi:MAG TPA: efflux RND transporter periplasmic adaptor subunit [Rhodocyclaceae bacterium]|nr:efflux RND transporter periplasmic adaptor subunit [Rhodocyclaceae bacterium]
MSENRHSSIGIHGSPSAKSQGVNRIRTLGRARKAAFIVFGLLLVGAAIVIGVRMSNANTLADVSREQSTRYVSIVAPKPATVNDTLMLPGTLQGITEATIYARTSGYVTKWYKDIGDKVKQGELLAQLEVPDLVQQLNEAKASQQLAQVTFDRWDALRKRDAVSQQDYEDKKTALATATATMKRLQEQVGFSRIVAPFDGVVTRRNIDIGNLVDAGGASRVLFTMAKSDKLRVYVYVPQNYAPRIKVGNKVDITLNELAGQHFAGTIARTSDNIDLATRTMQVEIQLDNADGKLLPGAYVQVGLKASDADAAAATSLPGNTILYRPEGTLAAVITNDSKVHLVPVTIMREYGSEIEVTGLKTDDKIIVNPSDSLSDGDAVSVVADKPTDKAADKPDAKKDASK